ncbi:hypothetical protein ACQKO6_17940 [Pseudomonas monteilii]
MKIIFDGHQVLHQGHRGRHQPSLPRKRVTWVGTAMVRDSTGRAVEASWTTPAGQRMNYLEAKAAVFAIVGELQRQFIADYQEAPGTATFILVGR